MIHNSIQRVYAVITAITAAFSFIHADIQFSPTPVWTAGTGYIPTGIGCADMDGNGWDTFGSNGSGVGQFRLLSNGF